MIRRQVGQQVRRLDLEFLEYLLGDLVAMCNRECTIKRTAMASPLIEEIVCIR